MKAHYYGTKKMVRIDYENGLQIWFSYNSPIAFWGPTGHAIRENEWGGTTGKHIGITGREAGCEYGPEHRVSGDVASRSCPTRCRTRLLEKEM